MSFADQNPNQEVTKQTIEEFLAQKLGEGKGSGMDKIIADVYLDPTPQKLMDIFRMQPNALRSVDKLGVKEEFGILFEGMDFSG